MGLEVAASRAFWLRAKPDESARQRLDRARSEAWFADVSEARLRYMLLELSKRFSSGCLEALVRWLPEPETQGPLVCHWHLQVSDPLYRDFTSGYLVRAWAGSGVVTVSQVEDWLTQRGQHSQWSPSTRRRLASGLLAAASDAGFLKGKGRTKVPHAVTVDAECQAYLADLLERHGRPAREEIFLSGTVRCP
jgi:hypothetical protein